MYTGTEGNKLVCAVGTGSNSTGSAPTYKLTLSLPGQLPEVFDNIGGSGNALYQNMADAINKGQSGLRGPSELVVATAGAATLAPVTGSITLSGGTDGVTSITSATLVGQDIIPRKGMYALRNTGVSVAMLAVIERWLLVLLGREEFLHGKREDLAADEPRPGSL